MDDAKQNDSRCISSSRWTAQSKVTDAATRRLDGRRKIKAADTVVRRRVDDLTERERERRHLGLDDITKAADDAAARRQAKRKERRYLAERTTRRLLR